MEKTRSILSARCSTSRELLFTRVLLLPSNPFLQVRKSDLGVNCPAIIVTTTPACTSTLLYFKLVPPYITDSDQRVLDSSGNDKHGVNGVTIGDLNWDCPV